ncbi:transposase [Mesotoga sp. H07.pep.5.3]|uniref:transposase n=1 Tax=Mesotoga sp. H07.pep.5.3 TaxID=1421003 RepID=UPI00117D4A1B
MWLKHPKGKHYDPEFKLRLVREFLETDKTLEEIAQEKGIVLQNTSEHHKTMDFSNSMSIVY